MAKDPPAQELPVSGDCRPVDFRDELPPVRDQGSIGWCYAFTAADLVSHRLRQNISPLDIAFQYNRSLNGEIQRRTARESLNILRRYIGLPAPAPKNPLTFEDIRNDFFRDYQLESRRQSGWVDRALLATQEAGGYCLEAVIRPIAESDVQFISTMGVLNHMRDSYHEFRQNSPETTGEEYLCQHYKIDGHIQRLIDQVGVRDIAHHLEGMLANDLFYHIITEQCPERIQQNFIPHEVNLNALPQQERLARIDALLDQNSILSINFHSQMLTGPGTPGEYHAATIVGRRMNSETRQCEYLVRNSWGASCELYGERDCDNGHIWIPQDTILDYAQEMNYLED